MLNNWVEKLKIKAKKDGINLIHGYVTGRPPGRVTSLNLPESEYNIFYNGAEIFKGLSKDKRTKLDSWEEINQERGFKQKYLKRQLKKPQKIKDLET